MWPIDSPSLPRDKLHEIFASRIVARGQNHQTLRAGEGHEAAIWQFFGQHEKFDPATNKEDGDFDDVIELSPAWGKLQALEHVVDRLVDIVGLARPTAEQLDAAITYADAYRPKVFKEISADAKAKLEARRGFRYFGIAAEQDVAALVGPLFTDTTRPPLLEHLLLSDRIIKSPHVTLVHEAEVKSADEAVAKVHKLRWDHYAQLVKAATKAGSDSLVVELTIGPRLVWDDRAMSLEVSALTSAAGTSLQLAVDGRSAHITVGTKEEDIRPVEGKLVLEAALRGDKTTELGGEIHVLEFEPVKVRGRIAGLR